MESYCKTHHGMPSESFKLVHNSELKIAPAWWNIIEPLH
jgi:hypothetical protein